MTTRELDTAMRHCLIPSDDGGEIAAQMTGAGPLIVLANGLGGSMTAWRPLVRHFAPRFRLASWDYRGLYRSPPPQRANAVSIEDHRSDLAAVLCWAGGPPAVLIGWSMGVQVAVDFAVHHPADVAGLVLVCGAPGDPFGGVFHTSASRWLVPLASRAVEAGAGPFGALVRALAASSWTPELLRGTGVLAPSCDLEVLRELAHDLARLDWRVYTRTIRAMGRHDARPRLGELRVPTLVVGGTRDLFTPVQTIEATANAIPGAEVFILPEATHYAPLEFPDELNARIDRFLADRSGD
jgi:pimeloyl-ACP methyl ester carboxylesterase